MPPVKHPHPFEDLVELAKPITYDPQRSLKEQFSAVDLLRRRSEVCRDEGDLENQYIYLGRAAAIINEHLPHHSQYNMITAKRQAHLAKNGLRMVRTLEELKPLLEERFQLYQVGIANGTIQPPKRRRASDHKDKTAPVDPTDLATITIARAPTPTEGLPALPGKLTPGATVTFLEMQEQQTQLQHGRRQHQRKQNIEDDRLAQIHNPGNIPENAVPIPVLTPESRWTPTNFMSQTPPSSAHINRWRGDPDRFRMFDTKIRAAMCLSEEGYDIRMKACLEDVLPMTGTGRMQRALDILAEIDSTERQWIEYQSQLALAQGQQTTFDKELNYQVSVQEQRLNTLRQIFARRSEETPRREIELNVPIRAEEILQGWQLDDVSLGQHQEIASGLDRRPSHHEDVDTGRPSSLCIDETPTPQGVTHMSLAPGHRTNAGVYNDPQQNATGAIQMISQYDQAELTQHETTPIVLESSKGVSPLSAVPSATTPGSTEYPASHQPSSPTPFMPQSTDMGSSPPTIPPLIPQQIPLPNQPPPSLSPPHDPLSRPQQSHLGTTPMLSTRIPSLSPAGERQRGPHSPGMKSNANKPLPRTPSPTLEEQRPCSQEQRTPRRNLYTNEHTETTILHKERGRYSPPNIPSLPPNHHPRDSLPTRNEMPTHSIGEAVHRPTERNARADDGSRWQEGREGAAIYEAQDLEANPSERPRRPKVTPAHRVRFDSVASPQSGENHDRQPSGAQDAPASAPQPADGEAEYCDNRATEVTLAMGRHDQRIPMRHDVVSYHINLAKDEASQSLLVTESNLHEPPCTAFKHLEEMRSLRGRDLCERLAQIIDNKSLRVQATSLKGDDAEVLSDLIHECLTSFPEQPIRHEDMLRLLQDICSASGELPSKYWLHNVNVNWRKYVARGGEAAIYEGQMGQQKVVVREVYRPDGSDWSSSSGEQVIQLIKREIIVHSQLRHPNIIPLLGVYRESVDEPPIMVMPFMENGAAPAFLCSDGRSDSDCARILIGTAIALSYLHSRSPTIIHGDLHPNNILVNPKGQAVLCDFGFSRIRYEVTRTHTNVRGGGRLRYLAPELSFGHEYLRTTTASDVYSLGMTLFNLTTLCQPFEEYRNEMAAADAARKGRRPQRPDTTRFFTGHFDTLWRLLVLLWASDESDRPAAATAAQRLERILQPLIVD